MSTHIRLIALTALFLLGACTSPGPTVPGDRASQQQALAQMDSWTARGKVALRSPDSSESASMLWQQRGEHTEIYLSGPVGVGATTLKSDGQTLEMRRGNDRQVFDISSRAALARNTGWDLPLAALPYWLRGLAAPRGEVQASSVDAAGRLATLEQDGWSVTYSNYQSVDGLILPGRLEAVQGDTRVKVIIHSWQMGAGH